MTQEEKDALLAEAKRRYPVGTEYNCARDGHINTAERDPEIIDTVDGDIDVGVGYIRYNGKWAKIVSTPQPQFEVGKWYKSKSGHTIKHKKKSQTYFHHGDYITSSGTFSYNKSDLGCTDDGTYKEVPLSEIQQYLPEGHPDKFVAAKDEEWEPKVGMWVKCIGDGNTDRYAIDGGWVNGLIFKVTRVTKEYRGIRNILWGGKKGFGVFKHNLVPALPHEIPGNEQQKWENLLISKTSNNSQFNTKQNGTNQKGIEVQRKTAKVTSGKRISGSAVSGRRSRTATASGHLSYKAIIGS